MESNIKLIIKAPNQKIEDQTMQCCWHWTVLQLKDHISLVYPAKPRVEDQRLIYSGHLLKNDQKLCDILESNDEKTFTIHLVCSQKQETIRSRVTTNERSSAFSNDVGVGDTNRTDDTNNFLNTNIPFQWNSASPEILSNSFTSPLMNQEQMMQQMAVMQQLYIQYMAQYLNQTGGNLDTLQPANHIVSNSPPSEANSSSQIAREAEAVPAQPQRMNAGPVGAAVDDDEEARNRDWLDWFYWISRTLVFVSILYFYSSLSRFLVVIGFGILLYLYQNGLLNGREEQRPRNAADQREAQRVQEMMDGNIDGHRTNVATRRDLEERYSGLRLLWVTVSSLFTSLIPEQAAPVNLN